MASSELIRIEHELLTVGYSLTSYEQLGLAFDFDIAEQLSSEAKHGEFSTSAAKLTERIEKSKMTIIQEQRALELGRTMVKPAVEAVFIDNQDAIDSWELYAINAYEAGGILGVHQDSVEKTVFIVTVSGVRLCHMYARGQSEGAITEPERTFTLNTGSIMILDAVADPRHSVECIEGPSVSAVSDVPALLRF